MGLSPLYTFALRYMRNNILILLSFFGAFWAAFLLLQNNTIYNSTLGKFGDNWVNNEGKRQLVNEPFQQVNNTNYLQWDGVHYHLIKEHGYDIKKAGGDYIFAFFPFFPFLWKITALPPVGVIFMNYFMFAIALLILYKTFQTDIPSKINLLLIIFSLPSIAVFFIPYTEATFLLVGAIGFYGMVKNKYWLFFVGFFLCALTKPSYTFLFLAILGTEVFFLIQHKKITQALHSSLLKALPLILGTLTVSSIQYSFEGGTPMKFVEVQKYWNHVFSIPSGLRDWSHEGFGMSLGVIFLIVVPLTTILLKTSYSKLFQANKNLPNNFNYTPKNYVQVLSAFYLIGIFLFIVFFQGGSLHGLSRYVLCTPFFFALLLYAFSYIKKTTKSSRVLYFCILSVLAMLTMGFAGYSSGLNFSDMGLFLLIASLFFWLFQDQPHTKFYKRGLLLTVFLNVIWTSYLFNTYIANGWIYT